MRSIVRTSGVLALGAVIALSACSSGSTAKAAKSSEATKHTAAPNAKSIDPASVPAAKSSGCGGAASSASKGQSKETLTSGGDARWYYREIPPAHDGVKATTLPTASLPTAVYC